MLFAVLLLVLCVFRYCGFPLWGVRNFSEEEKAAIPKCRTLTATVTERWKSKDGYVYVLNNTVAEKFAGRYCPGKIRMTGTARRFEIGTRIRASGKISFYERESNPGGFDKKTYYEAQGIRCRFVPGRTLIVTGYDKRFRLAEIAANVREDLTDLYISGTGSEFGSILSAMITGEKGEMEEETRVNYTVSGLGHLLAISGLHVGIVGMALLRLLIRLRIKRSVASIISSAFLFAYCIVTGAHDSTLRAFIMFSVMAGARCLLRSYDMPSSLSFAGIILLALNPYRLFTAGFLLSFGAAGGLAVVYPALKRALPSKRSIHEGKIRQRLAGMFYDGFFVWLSVNLMTLPILLWFYREFPIYGFAANILFVPMTEVIILLGIAGGAAGLLWPAAGRLILKIPGVLVFLQDGAGEVIRRLPGYVYITGKPDLVRILSYCAGLTVLLFWLRYAENKKALTPVLCVILMTPIFIRPYHDFCITAIDVGQGDAIFITNGSGSAMMIDAGSSSYDHCGKYILVPFLKTEGISELECVFISHNDSDHMNGVLELLKMKAEKTSNIHIKRLLMPGWMEEDEIGLKLSEAAKECGTEVIYLHCGHQIRSGGVTFTTVFPPADASFTGNEGSLVLGLRYNGFTALFTGDLEGDAEELVAEEIGHYDCLKAAHHGSNGSTSEKFLEAVSPSVCLISAPKVSIYNHPGPETIKRIESAGAAWFQTGIKGALFVRYKNGKILVNTYCS